MRRYPAYKDSGLEWLGEVPAHWIFKRLKYVAKINPARNPSYSKESTEPVTFLPMEMLSERGGYSNAIKKPIAEVWSGYTYFERGDVVFAKITPCFENGKGALLDNLESPIGFGTTELHVLRAGDLIHPKFLYFLTRSYPFKSVGAEFMTGSAGQKRVPTDHIANYLVALPPLTEQEAIVAFLEEKTAAIDQFLTHKRRLVALLAEQKQAVINTAVTQGLDTAVPRKPSGIDWLGDIPAHWEVKKLKYVAKVQTGLTLGQKYPNVPLIERPYLRVANVQDGYLDLAEVKTIQLPADKAVRYELQAGDVLMTEGGDYDKLGRGYVWERQINDCLHQNHIFAVRPDKEVLKPYFLTALMSSSHGREYFIEASKQTTNLASINSTRLKRFPVLLPNPKEQQDILDYLEQKTAAINTAIAHAQRHIALMEEYRTALIAQAVTGQIDVRAA